MDFAVLQKGVKMKDLIERQAAISAIAEYARKLKEEKYHAGSKVTRECYRILTDLPGVGWIPCSERMPACEQEVLICTEKKLVGRKSEIKRKQKSAIFSSCSL